MKKARKRKVIEHYYDPELVVLFKTIRRLEAMPAWKLRCFFVRLLLGTGLRRNEARKLRRQDCNPDFFRVVEGKGGDPRDVEPSPEFKPYYQAYLRELEQKGQNYFFPAQQLVKRGRFLRPMSTSSISLGTARNWWADVIREAGIRFIPLHAARRTYTTWESERLKRQDLQDQLGHRDYRTTDTYYRGSQPGRRYYKPDPEWWKWAAMPEDASKLRVIEGGKVI